MQGKAATEYLKPRAMLIDVSPVSGKWNRKKHERLCASGVDADFENWNDVGKEDEPTPAAQALLCDLVKDGTYAEIVPDEPESFFRSAEQSMQAVHDNPSLQEEVLKQDRCLHLPFVNANGDKFVTLVFRRFGALDASVRKFSRGHEWYASRGHVFVLPLRGT